MSAEKIQERFRQLKLKFPDVNAIRFDERMDGIVLVLIMQGFERPELFKGITEDLLRDIAYQTWPKLIQTGDGGAYHIRRNETFLGFAAHLEEADQHLRVVAAHDYEAIFTVLDADGIIKARYVSKMDGIVKRLED